MAFPLDTLDIVEIIRPTDSGQTQPFLCLLEDDQLYAVKGREALHRGLIGEVVAGCLGQALGLPIPPFVIASLPPLLFRPNGGTSAAQAIGRQPAFASAWQESAQAVTPTSLTLQPQDMLARLYVFDHWIANGDRSLSEINGNPNLFVRLDDNALVAIDHNLAFDPSYDPAKELPLHACRDAWHRVHGRNALCADISDRMDAAIALLPAIIDSLPEEWLEDQEALSGHIAATLQRKHRPIFWAELG